MRRTLLCAALTLAACCPCPSPVLATPDASTAPPDAAAGPCAPEREYLPLRIVRAEYIAEAHTLSCENSEPPPPPSFECLRLLEVHDPVARCIATAAEQYELCSVQSCASRETCRNAYLTLQAACGDSDWATVLDACR